MNINEYNTYMNNEVQRKFKTIQMIYNSFILSIISKLKSFINLLDNNSSLV